jgi:hypothetical protein
VVLFCFLDIVSKYHSARQPYFLDQPNVRFIPESGHSIPICPMAAFDPKQDIPTIQLGHHLTWNTPAVCDIDAVCDGIHIAAPLSARRRLTRSQCFRWK